MMRYFIYIIVTLMFTSCSSVNVVEVLRIDNLNSEWRTLKTYSHDSTLVYREVQYHINGLSITLPRDIPLLENSRHGPGPWVATGPPLIPIYFLPVFNISPFVLAGGLKLSFTLQSESDTFIVDFSKSNVKTPNSTNYPSRDLYGYKNYSPRMKLDTLIVKTPSEIQLYELEFELSNLDVHDYSDSLSVYFPSFIKSNGDTIHIPVLKLKKSRSYKYYPLTIGA